MNLEPNSAVQPEQPLSGPIIAIWLVLSWLWVGIPLGWGVYTTGVNALKLFE